MLGRNKKYKQLKQWLADYLQAELAHTDKLIADSDKPDYWRAREDLLVIMQDDLKRFFAGDFDVDRSPEL